MHVRRAFTRQGLLSLRLAALALLLATSAGSAQSGDDEYAQDDRCLADESETESPDSDDQEAESDPDDDNSVVELDLDCADPDDLIEDGDTSDDVVPLDTALNPEGTEWVMVEEDGPESQNSEDGFRADPIPTMRRQPIGQQTAPGEPTLYSAGSFVVPENAMPYMAELFNDAPASQLSGFPQNADKVTQALARHACGGALIARDWVITAAHCVTPPGRWQSDEQREEFVKEYFKVKLGAEDLVEKSAMIYRIGAIYSHDKFSSRPIKDDIALIRLVPDQRPRNPKEVRPIALHAGPVLPQGTPVTSTGWGKTQATDRYPATIFNRAINLQTTAADGCPIQPGFGRLPNVICARADRKKMCKGDSGSPLVLTNGSQPRIVGVVSWGISTDKDCGETGQPGVYTQIQAYFPWICRVMGRDAEARECQKYLTPAAPRR